MKHAHFFGDMNYDGLSQNAMKIIELERLIQQMQLQSFPRSGKQNDACVAVLGNFPSNLAFRDASMWCQEKFEAVCNRKPEIFMKGDLFNGILFAKFGSEESRDEAVTAFGKARLSHGTIII